MFKIKAIEYSLPINILTNNALEQEFPDWSAEKIESKTGIKERHIASANETALDLAIQACEKVLAGYNRQSIDFLLFCTQSPDYILPTSACIIQDRLGLRKNIGAVDFNLGCSGFVYGLALVNGLIASRLASNVLLVMAETYSKHIHPLDKANRTIFGDAAAATIIEASNESKSYTFNLGTDGSGYSNLIIPNGGARQKTAKEEMLLTDESGNSRTDNNLYMNGPEIFNFTIESIPGLVKETLAQNNLSMDDIGFFIFHQANKFILNYLRKKIKIPEEKFYINMEYTGNTVSATIPIAIKQCLDNNIIKPKDKVMVVGFGVGYSWGATIIEI